MNLIGYLHSIPGRVDADRQREAISVWCAHWGHNLRELVEDRDADRSGLENALDRLAGSGVDGIVVVDLHHLGPDIDDRARILARIRRADGTLVQVGQGPVDPDATATMSI